MKRKALSVILSLCLVLSLFPGISFAAAETEPVASADQLSDVRGHWAMEAIENAVESGYVKGYPDGSFRPDRPVSRAEFVSMVNNALQLRPQNKVALNFSDVKASDWYYEEIAKAGYVRYAQGTSASTFSPESVITRQEAALMLSRFLPKVGMTGKEVLESYPDKGQIESWARDGVAITLNKGYMKGHANGLLAPLGTLTRAEAVTLIDQILDGETIVREDVFVKESGDILSNKIYVGDITIAEEVGEGDATLQNLSALSVVYVKGGGSHTVTMENSLIIRLVVTKEGTQVRVLAADGTTIYTSILFNNNLLVDEEGNDALPDGETFEDIVVVQGTVSSEDAQRIAAAIADQVESGRPVTPEQVTQAVQSVLTNSNTRTDESGTIVVEVPTTPGNTGGNRRSTITSVTVTGETDYTTATLAAVLAPAAATADYQWSRSETENGTYTQIETATGAGITIAAEDIGCFLKVTATGNGSYAGSQASAVIGPIGFDGGSGTEADPFEIANWYHLNNMRYQLDKDFILTANLSDDELLASLAVGDPAVSSVSYVSTGYDAVVGDPVNGWEPVGRYPMLRSAGSDDLFHGLGGDEPGDDLFTGVFDGNGMIIRDLYVMSEDMMPLDYDGPPYDAAGLFGTIYMAEVRDVILMDAYVEGTDYVGTLAGYSRESIISGVDIRSMVRPDSVSASFRMPGVSGDTRVGGVVGRNDIGVVENCFNDAEVYGTQYVGGIAGSNYVENMLAARDAGPDPEEQASITLCVNEGYVTGYAYVGGIAGGNGYSYEISEGVYEHGVGTPAYIEQCLNDGVVESDSGMPLYAIIPMKFGGIAGGSTGTISESCNSGLVNVEAFAAGGIVGSTNGIVENCYNLGQVLSDSYYGGIVGYAQEATIRYNYNIGDVSSIYPVDAMRLRTAYQICGYDEGEWSDDYELSSFSANIYLQDMDLKSLADASGIDYIGIYDATEEEMRNPLTYRDQIMARIPLLSEWDFQSVWAMNLQDNGGLPFLRWQWSDSSHEPITLEVTMPTAEGITYGDYLADAILRDGEVTVDDVVIEGTFSYWDEYHTPEIEQPSPDSLDAMVLFVPADPSYAPFAGHVTVSIARGIPEITAIPSASPITLGDPLSSSTLTGGAAQWDGSPIDGSFSFDTPAYEPDSVGTYTAAITFTPDYDWLYESVSGTVDVSVVSGPAIVFETDFEADNGGFVSSGTGSMWEHGAPVTWPASLPSGSNCWGTDLDSFYVDGIDGLGWILTSPEIDLTVLPGATPVNVQWMQTWALEGGYDYCDIEYQLDGGGWTSLARTSTTNTAWTAVGFEIPGAAGHRLHLRWRLTTDWSILNYGIYLDDFFVEAGNDSFISPYTFVVDEDFGPMTVKEEPADL